LEKNFTRAGRQIVCIIFALACCHAVRAAAAQSGQSANDKRATKNVMDETGRHVTIPLNVQHIVTLAPDLTETIYALGLENKLAGDTS
jgi:ABC-type Fe3+-hydroxamate transport system substrate-binding protein